MAKKEELSPTNNSCKSDVIPYEFGRPILERMQKILDAKQLTPEQREAIAQASRDLTKQEVDLGLTAGTPTKGRKKPAIPVTQEGRTILEAMANEGSMTLTQEDLADAAKLSLGTIKKELKYLRAKKLVAQPLGPKKGFTLTDKGRLLIDGLP
jgi:predicted transcriptional regulator